MNPLSIERGFLFLLSSDTFSYSYFSSYILPSDSFSQWCPDRHIVLNDQLRGISVDELILFLILFILLVIILLAVAGII